MTNTIRFLTVRVVNVVRRRGRKFVFLPRIEVGPTYIDACAFGASPNATADHNSAALNRAMRFAEGITFRGEPEIPGGPAELSAR